MSEEIFQKLDVQRLELLFLIDSIPTAIRNIRDHFEVCLSIAPWISLADPINISPIASKVTKNSIVYALCL